MRKNDAKKSVSGYRHTDSLATTRLREIIGCFVRSEVLRMKQTGKETFCMNVRERRRSSEPN